ncbi:hypothetical protein [Pseudolysinimonas yzui]|uniref:hypothetical protein n=1 Tax=Pseudolysinimonas yzui TaxID=2708254 RepID=UPI00174D0751|nr:hypothetical protein [Pseudolysinimonas yzui]
MRAYDTSETFQTWNVLDSFFREMPSGTVLRVDRREDTTGRTVITYGNYEKDRGKDGSFELVAGLPMFFYEDGTMAGGTVGGEDPSQFVYPDEMLMARDITDLRFRIVSLGSPRK